MRIPFVLLVILFLISGPQVTLDCASGSVAFSYLSPAVQELGGVHQELKGIWTAR